MDRDPASEERWREFSSTAPSRTQLPALGLRARPWKGLRGEGVRPDGIVFDLGMSSMQVDDWDRGFSYAYDAPLDMRMDPEQKLSAAEVVNDWPQERIARVLREFGEERRAGSMAREIVRRRPIETTAELVAAIKAAVPPSDRFGRGHPAKRAFQAIRIAVNGELEALDRALPLAWQLLAVGGRLGAISFHSLEDRRVKRFLADRARGCICPPEIPVCVCGREPEAELLTKRALAPDPRGDRAQPALVLGASARRAQAPRARARRGERQRQRKRRPRLMGAPALAPRREPARGRRPGGLRANPAGGPQAQDDRPQDRGAAQAPPEPGPSLAFARRPGHRRSRPSPARR